MFEQYLNQHCILLCSRNKTNENWTKQLDCGLLQTNTSCSSSTVLKKFIVWMTEKTDESDEIKTIQNPIL